METKPKLDTFHKFHCQFIGFQFVDRLTKNHVYHWQVWCKVKRNEIDLDSLIQANCKQVAYHFKVGWNEDRRKLVFEKAFKKNK